MQTVCAFKRASSSCLLTREHRPSIRPRIVAVHALREPEELKRSTSACSLPLQGEVGPTRSDESGLWDIVRNFFLSQDDMRREALEEEYGPYAFEAMMPAPKERSMYQSHICDRLAVEGSGDAH